MSKRWVRTKTTKIGARKVTDSRMPRRLRMTSKRMASSSNSILYGRQPAGKKLNSASPQETIETVMVSM